MSIDPVVEYGSYPGHPGFYESAAYKRSWAQCKVDLPRKNRPSYSAWFSNFSVILFHCDPPPGPHPWISFENWSIEELRTVPEADLRDCFRARQCVHEEHLFKTICPTRQLTVEPPRPAPFVLDEAFDAMMEAASIPDLAGLIRQAVAAGAIQTQRTYP